MTARPFAHALAATADLALLRRARHRYRAGSREAAAHRRLRAAVRGYFAILDAPAGAEFGAVAGALFEMRAAAGGFVGRGGRRGG